VVSQKHSATVASRSRKADSGITVPGILLHYALRKRCIAQLAREALHSGATQVVIIGAGFDALSLELQREFPDAHFWEIDHPQHSVTKPALLRKRSRGRSSCRWI
jgi:O-methyltransferase involved in polyketide biosynthesis